MSCVVSLGSCLSTFSPYLQPLCFFATLLNMFKTLPTPSSHQKNPQKLICFHNSSTHHPIPTQPNCLKDEATFVFIFSLSIYFATQSNWSKNDLLKSFTDERSPSKKILTVNKTAMATALTALWPSCP